MAFSDVLKYLREEREITQKELAAACNLSPQCICNLEQGTRNPTGSTVAVLATFFGVSADYLLELENDFGAPTVAPMGDTYTAEERQIIEKYRGLNLACKKLINNTLDTLVATSTTATEQKKKA